jgi:hypothetical protein
MSGGILGPDQSTDYIIESAILSTDRVEGGSFFDIKRLITDFEIFEHIDKPYLTAQFAFYDSYSIVEGMDIQGGEKLTITIRSTVGTPENSRSIRKEFQVTKILKSQKVNDQAEMTFIHCTEYHAFKSNVYNINRSYTGSPDTIIDSIVSSYLNKRLLYTDDLYQGNMKLIVPNLNPLEACLWIKNRSTSTEGLPFYLFSVLGDDFLRFYDLGTLLRTSPMNKSYPYVYTQSNSFSQLNPKFHVIQSYEYANTEDLYSLIDRGVVGAEYAYYDTTTGVSQVINFDVNAVFTNLVEKDYLRKDQNRYNYGPGYKVDDRNLHTIQSRKLTQIAAAGVYLGAGDFKSFHEESSAQAHRKKIVGKALKNFMTKSPITIQVSGRNFISGREYLDGEGNYTIGNVIRVLFYNNIPDTNDKPQIDRKKSGDYIIYATRHVFSTERYDTKLLLAKLASYTGDPEL